LPDHEGQLRHNEDWLAQQRIEAELDNHGFRRVERLPGNVGSLEISHLPRAAWGRDTAIAAMDSLAGTSALIIDLRGCTGGYPDMVVLLLSYLFDEEPVHLNSIYWRDEDITQEYWTQPEVPGERFGDKPVYVLVGPETFSGGEELAYDLQARQRATLVGERTGGGAHPGASFRLHPHFEVFIPVGRAINPVTGGNWERTGVIPDITVPAEQAFNTAYRLALKGVIENISKPPSGALEALLQEALAALEDLEDR
jgi:C-terminal processing protease CtpA/Prc